jgi:hypothetical protein
VNAVIPDSKRVRYFNQMMNGGVYLPNTMINNLTKVDSWDYAQVGIGFCDITFMGEQGYTLVVMQESKVNSVYIGKVTLREAKGIGGIVATTENIFGEINPSEKIFGCRNPESVVDVNRNFYFYDSGTSNYILYAANGMHPVSDYKANKFFRDITDLILSNDAAVFSGWDQRYDEVLVSVVTLPNNEPVGSIAFSEFKNRWTDERTLYTINEDNTETGIEGFDCLNNVLITFQDGKVWVFDNPVRNNFLGTQHSTSVEVVGNKNPTGVKTWESLALDTNKNWTAVVEIPASESYSRGMYSRIKNFVKREGRMWAAFGRNMKTHQSTASLSDLVNGDYLKGNVIRVTLTNTDTDEATLFGVTINAIESK